jgi:hypothetical protein
MARNNGNENMSSAWRKRKPRSKQRRKKTQQHRLSESSGIKIAAAWRGWRGIGVTMRNQREMASAVARRKIINVI